MSLGLTTVRPLISGLVGPVLAELKRLNPDIEIFGPTADAANAAPKSIWWVPAEESWDAPKHQGQPGLPGAIFYREIPVSFLVFGGACSDIDVPIEESSFYDCDETEIIISKLTNIMHRMLSQRSYRWTASKWFNSGRTGIGMSCEVTFSFVIPLVREDNPTVTLTEITPKMEIANG